jgi:chemotaxis protein CheD
MSVQRSDQKKDQPPLLPGFEHIRRYWDNLHQVHAAKILPGEYYVTAQNEVIVTVLGSCVSVCIRDRIFGIGGMNHFMLPVGSEEQLMTNKNITSAARYGNYAMEQLINEILKNGGKRQNLEVKVFGGGRVLQHMQSIDIGRRNIEFIKDYINTEQLTLLAEDLGDVFPRKVMYFPLTGRARIKKLRSMLHDTILERESQYFRELEQKPVEGDIELFD